MNIKEIYSPPLPSPALRGRKRYKSLLSTANRAPPSWHHHRILFFSFPSLTVAFLRTLHNSTSMFDFRIFVQEGNGEHRAGSSNSTVERPPRCFACMRKLDVTNTTGDDQTPSVCGNCKNLFCFQCDVYIHEKLHNCPGCENLNAAGVWWDVWITIFIRIAEMK